MTRKKLTQRELETRASYKVRNLPSWQYEELRQLTPEEGRRYRVVPQSKVYFIYDTDECEYIDTVATEYEAKEIIHMLNRE